MNINATILGQFLTFAILVWFTMKYVWPNIIGTLQNREKKIAAGLEAAEQSKRALETAEQQAVIIVRAAKQNATHLIEQANLHSAQLVEEAKSHAKQEGTRLVEMAQVEIDKEITRAKEALKAQVAVLAVAGAEKIIQRNLDPDIHRDLLNKLAAEI